MKKTILLILSSAFIFSSCGTTKPTVQEEVKVKQEKFYTFHYQGKAKEVYLSGNFNNWKQKDSRFQLLSKDSENWEISVSENLLKKGRNEYKIIADGEWKIDSKVATEESGLSGKINVLLVQ